MLKPEKTSSCYTELLVRIHSDPQPSHEPQADALAMKTVDLKTNEEEEDVKVVHHWMTNTSVMEESDLI